MCDEEAARLRGVIETADAAVAEALDLLTGWCSPEMHNNIPAIHSAVGRAMDALREVPSGTHYDNQGDTQ